MKRANKPGLYKNFSGEIKWLSTACVVRNADFEILEKEDENKNAIFFDDAVFVSGDIRWCLVKNGLNLGCYFFGCDIEYMINKNGVIFNCDWHDGLFEGGVFKCGRWFDGIWISGEWDDGKNSAGVKMKLPPNQWVKK